MAAARHEQRAGAPAPGDVLTGIGGSAGQYEGVARVVTDLEAALALEPGEILVAPLTDAAWTPLFLVAGAVVVDVGAMNSHAVVVSRELGIPCVLSLDDATERLRRRHAARRRRHGRHGHCHRRTHPSGGQRMTARFEGKVAFVTGGASGLGAAAARRFSDEGAKVVVADINEDAAREVAQGLKDGFAVRVDTSDAAAVEAAVAAAVEHYGGIDTVFNNAGITGPQQILHEMDIENWDHVRAVNGDGVFYVMKYTIAAMLATGGGSIVNTSSTAGLTGQLNISNYTFAKAGIVGLTRSAAIEYAKQNVRVNAIAPTVVWTPLVENFANSAADPEGMRAMMEQFNPMPGIPQPDEVAAVVAFLASDEARWITGHTVPIDGGYCAQ